MDLSKRTKMLIKQRDEIQMSVSTAQFKTQSADIDSEIEQQESRNFSKNQS